MNSLIYTGMLPRSIQSAFTEKVSVIAAHLGIRPAWLMQVMKAESGLSPLAENRQKGHLIAVGLIQFTYGAGIRAWGETLESILAKDALQQLGLVQRYFEPYRGRIHSYYDLYAVTFFPAIIGKPDSWVLQTKTLSADLIARQNPAINRLHRKYITVADFKTYVRDSVPPAFRAQVFDTVA